MWYVQHCWLLSWAAYLPDRGWPKTAAVQLPLRRPLRRPVLAALQVRNNSAFSGPRWICAGSLLHVNGCFGSRYLGLSQHVSFCRGLSVLHKMTPGDPRDQRWARHFQARAQALGDLELRVRSSPPPHDLALSMLELGSDSLGNISPEFPHVEGCSMCSMWSIEGGGVPRT